MKAILTVTLLLAGNSLLRAVETERIDLPAAMRLAGAQNLDVQLAQERLDEARAAEDETLWQFFPTLGAGVGYAAHNGRIQDVGGTILDVDKQQVTFGPSLSASLDFGEAVYKRLAARQLTSAAGHAIDAQKRASVLAAVEAYLDLAKAHADASVAREAVKVAQEYKQQLANGVNAGVAFKGDELRSETQLHRHELLLKQAEEQRGVAGARLAELLHLRAGVLLLPRENDVVPVNLKLADSKLEHLLAQAYAQRPELKVDAARLEAANAGLKGARYGPMVPSLGAHVVAGGLGGGRDGSVGGFGGSGDYQVTLGWRIGPGGLFDKPRIRAAESRTRQAETLQARTHDEVTRQVTENYERVKALREELRIARQNVGTANETLKLALERKEFAVGIVLETLQSEQDLVTVKLEYVNTVIEQNRAQYRLRSALGL